MIQIATLGDVQVVVEEGLRKNPPEKLYILHTENERTKSKFDEDLKKAKGKDKDRIKTQQYKDNAEKLKKKIVNDFDIPVHLVQVDKYGTYDVIREIQNIISKEKKYDTKLSGKDFAINITGGTKAMVAGAACSAYLAQTKMYYVLQYNEAKGKEELVKELPVPPRVKSKNTISGSTESTTSRILQRIWESELPIGRAKLLESFSEGMPVEVMKAEMKKDKKTGKYKKTGEYNKKTEFKPITSSLLNFHLDKLEDAGLITRTTGREILETGKVDKKSKFIDLTEFGRLHAAYPETIGDLI